MTKTQSMASEYEGYFEAKNWSATNSEAHYWYYDSLAKRLHLPAAAPKLRVLEIGFGDGRFLDWCRHKAIETVVGVEIQQEAIARAQARGHEVYIGPLVDNAPPAGKTFDLICAFDVLEHLTKDEIRDFFRITERMLASDGRYILRFPNGNSPFLGPDQFGDPTHKTVVNAGLVHTLGAPFGLGVEREINDRILPPTGLARLRRRFVYFMRGMVEAVVGFAYFGQIIAIDPNVFVVVARKVAR